MCAIGDVYLTKTTVVLHKLTLIFLKQKVPQTEHAQRFIHSIGLSLNMPQRNITTTIITFNNINNNNVSYIKMFYINFK